MVSISEPGNPVKIDTVDKKGRKVPAKGAGQFLVYKGGKIYCSSLHGELRIYDVTDPVTPRELYNSGNIGATAIEVR